MKGVATASMICIGVNLLLTAVKAVVGFITGSVAIINDAISNLNDLINGLITMVGIIIAGKQPDREHPYGYGQIEYVSTTSLAVMELLAGFAALAQSVKRILEPDPAETTRKAAARVKELYPQYQCYIIVDRCYSL